MKLHYVNIKNYKNFDDLNLVIDNSLNIISIIGNNGSGKSNLLEAIALAFIDIVSEKESVDFIYEIEYNIYDEDIRISNKASKIVEKSGKKVSKKDIFTVLPTYLFSYYSGDNTRLLNIFKRNSDKEYESRLKKGEELRLKNLTYIKGADFGANLLTNLIYETSILNEIKKLTGISSISGPIKFYIRRPKWGSKNAMPETYWGAVGSIEQQLRMIEDKGKFVTIDKDSAYIEINNMKELFDEKIGAIGLFTIFKVLLDNEILENISFEIKKNGVTMSYVNLSEGEKQIVQLLGLLDISKDYRALFLLDEPDTFLHPKWQREFVNIMSKIDIHGQLLFTTHSPLALGKVQDDSIFILSDGNSYLPSSSSYNRDVSDVLNEIMDVTSRPNEIEEEITKFNRLIALKDVNSARKQLVELAEVLSEKDPFLVKAKNLLRRLEILK
jgi:predicted ATP-dependent endonuclease of OLD family